MTKTLKIEGMSCAHCTAAVTKALNALDGAENAVVDLESGTATVIVTDAITDDILRAAVVEEGFDVIGIA